MNIVTYNSLWGADGQAMNIVIYDCLKEPTEKTEYCYLQLFKGADGKKQNIVTYNCLKESTGRQ